MDGVIHKVKDEAAKPLFPLEKFDGRIQESLCGIDSEGNIIIVVDDQISIDDRDEVTNLYIQKVNQDYNTEWFIRFKNGDKFSIYDMLVDQDNNVVVVGVHWSESTFPLDARNFYLKVNTDRLVTVTKGINTADIITLFPNPTSGEVYWNAKAGQLKGYSVYDEQGIKVKEGMVVGVEGVDIHELPAGRYFIHLTDGSSRAMSKVIKY